MLKILMMVHIIGGGKNPMTFNNQLNFQQFQTMEQCEYTKSKLKEQINEWHYGSDKSNKIPIFYNIDCIELPNQQNDTNTKLNNTNIPIIQPTINKSPKLHKRWNDIY